MKAKYSGYDSTKSLYIDCVECTQGSNGSAECDKGWNNNEPKEGGCYCGVLLPELSINIIPKGMLNLINIIAMNLYIEPDAISPSSMIGPGGLGADSLTMAILSVDLEAIYDLEFSDEDWRKFKTVQDIWDYLEAAV